MATTTLITRAADIVKAGRESEERRTDHVLVLILVDTTAPRELVLTVRDAFDPRLPGGEVRVHALGDKEQWAQMPDPDVCVTLVGSRTALVADEVTDLAFRGVPVALVVESVLDAPRLSLGSSAQLVSVVAGTSPEVLRDRLAEWLIGATRKSVAFAANFAFCRRAKTRELVNSFAVDNAMVMAQTRGKADLPLMIYNQARLALDIAAVNGEPLALRRIPEVLAAAGAGFGSRMMANQVGGRLPFVGMFFKAGFDFLGTEATGMALQARFDKRERIASGEEIPPSKASQLASRAVKAVKTRVQGREGSVVRSTGDSTVRLLPDSEHGPALVYEQGDAL